MGAEGPRGFRTPSKRVEFYSERLAEARYPPLSDYEEPLVSPQQWHVGYPLVLTYTKDTLFCKTCHVRQCGVIYRMT